MAAQFALQTHTFNYWSYVHFLRWLGSLSGESQLAVDLRDHGFFYPDGMAPLIATLARLRGKGYEIDVMPPEGTDLRQYFDSVGWSAAINGEPAPPQRRGSTYVPLSSYADSEELNGLISGAIGVLADTSVFPEGILDAVEWSVNEVADNVLVHAGEPAEGWMQLTSYPQKAEVEMVVVDIGRGIRDSLKEGYPELGDDQKALNLAVQKGITRDREIGQGNGLSGVFNIVRAAKGWLNLHSGSGLLRLAQGDLQFPAVPVHVGTLVTMTLPTNKPIDLGEALWGYKPLPAFERQYLGDEGISFVLKEEASGFGNRPTARALRSRLTNLMKQFPSERVVIDFRDVDLVTASFADEFIAKLVQEVGGVVNFFGRVQLRNVTQFVGGSLNEVIQQRMTSEGPSSTK